MNKTYNLKGEVIEHSQVKSLFASGLSVCMISYALKIFQSECIQLLDFTGA